MASFLTQVSGPMLDSNLLRHGELLAFDTSLLVIDSANSRIGIGTNSPQTDFHVTGISTLGDITVSGDLISNNTLNQDITISPNGTGYLVTPQQKITSLLNDRVVFTGAGGELLTDSGLQFNPATGLTSTLATIGDISFSSGSLTRTGNITLTANTGIVSVNSIQVSDLPTGSIPFSNGSNTLTSTLNLQWDETFNTLSLVGIAVINDLTLSNNNISSNSDISLTPATNGRVVVTSNNSITVPVGTTTERPATPSSGDLRLNSTSSQLEYYNGSAWVVAGTDFQAITYDTFVGDDVTTTFTLSTSPADAANVFVSINGVVQQPNTAYSILGNQITFSTAPASTDVIDVRELVRSYSFDSIRNATNTASVTTTVDDVVIAANGILNASGTGSVRLPQLTTAQVLALPTPSDGDTVYVTDGDAGNPCLAVYDGTAWKKVLFDANL